MSRFDGQIDGHFFHCSNYFVWFFFFCWVDGLIGRLITRYSFVQIIIA